MRTLITVIFVAIISMILLSAKDVNIKQINTNSNGIDVAPYLSIDGKFMVFGSDKEGSELDPSGKSSFDLWVMKDDNGVFSSPEGINSSPIFGNNFFNTKFLESSFTMTADGKMILFASCGRTDSYGDCDIYWSRLKDEGWSMPAPLGRSINSINWDGMPSISADGKTLYFVSNRKGSKGGSFDIWYSVYDTDMEEWGTAQNFTEINTKFDDFCPYIAPDGLTLFFSSNGFEDSFGGLDFYIIKYDKTKNKWGKPENLGEPFNTAINEKYISFDGSATKMVFSRNDALTQTIKEQFYTAEVEPYFNPIQSFNVNVVSGESGNPVFVNIIGKTAKKRIFSSNGNSTRVIISEKDFDFADYIDIEIQVKNPNFEKQNKTIRLFNSANMNEEKRKEYLDKMNFTVNFALNEPGKTQNPNSTLSLITTNLTITDPKNTTNQIKEVSIDENLVVENKAILNYIFFDENKSNIPSRYNISSSVAGRKYSESDLVGMSNIDIYYNLLNVIGKRMLDNPAYNITITGCNSNKGKEQKNMKLSKDRAQAVADVLAKEWGINPERMTIANRALPELPNNGKTKEAAEENQRVEISSTDASLFSGITIQENKFIAKPENILIDYKTDYKNSTGDWVFSIRTKDSARTVVKGQNSATNQMDWNVSQELSSLITGTKKLLNKITDVTEKKEVISEDPTFLESAKSALKKAGEEISKTANDFEKSFNKDDKEKVRKAQEKERVKRLIIFELLANDNSSSKEVVSKIEIPFKSITTKEKKEKNIAEKKLYRCEFLVMDPVKGLSDSQNQLAKEINTLLSQSSNKKVISYYDQTIDPANSKLNADKYATVIATAFNSTDKQVLNVADSGIIFNNKLPEGRFYNKRVILEFETVLNNK
ncbi:MAG: OmpA family protein [bacterium]